MIEWIHDLGQWVLHWAETPYSVYALFLIAFAESSFFPIPPDVLLIAMSILDPPGAFTYALVCTLGSLAGAVFGFLLGVKGGRPLLLKLFRLEKILMVERYYQKWDVWAVAIAAFTPIPYKVFTISAGVFELNFKRFLLASAVGRSGRFFLVALAIYFFGPAIKELLTKYLNLFTVVFIVLLFLGFWVVRHLARRSAKNEETHP
ncbi:MAG: DedA family protein [Deltaproteobacteria bacterium]|nr:DedA family protein [Deltaproteobacteria bacterium]